MLMTDKQARIQLKRDTAENWERENIALLEGEIGYETDTGKYKIGRMINGELASWSELDYSNEDFNLYLERLEQYGDGNIEPTSDEYFSFELNEDKKSYTILAKEELNSAKIETLAIPYEYNGLPIFRLGSDDSSKPNFCDGNIYIKKLYIPNNIIEINGGRSFVSCLNLQYIRLSEHLQALTAGGQFYELPALKEIKFPETITDIHMATFFNNPNLIHYIPRNNIALQEWVLGDNHIAGPRHYAYYDDLVLTAHNDETKKFKIQIDSNGKLTATALFSESAVAATTTEEMEVN